MPTPFRQQKQSSPGIGPFLLFVLPLPLVIVIAASLLKGHSLHLLSSLASLSLIWLAAWFVKRAHYYQWQSSQRKWSRSTRFPWKMAASIFTAAGVFILTTFILQHNIVVAVLGSGLAYLGVLLKYGLDPQFDRNKDVTLVGVTTEELIEIFDEAELNLKEINNSAKSINNKELKDRLNRISDKTQGILKQIEEDPKDLRRARKFLKVYLKGARKVATQYAASHHLKDNKELEENFRNVLTTIEEVIEEQTIKLQENDILDLDVKIEVLEAQLKHEGVI